MVESVRVVYVNGTSHFADATAERLEREDDRLDVVTEASAEDGIARLEAAEFDCVVSDYDLPGMDGLAFLDAVREVHSDFPFILFAERRNESVVRDAISREMTDYLRKDAPDAHALLANRIINFVPAATDQQGLVRTDRGPTERGERAKELERYETIVEASGDGVYTLNADGEITFVNDTLVETVGYDADDLLGSHVSTVMDPADVEKGAQLIRSLLESERDRGTFEMDVVTADGERIPCENHVALLPFEDEFQGTVGVVRDITERKARERELKRQNERLEEFAAVVSHDLRNPLNVASGHLELASEECDSDHLDTARSSLDRMDQIIDDVLTMAREGGTVEEVEAVSLATLATDCWRNVDTGTAELQVADDLTFRADPNRLHHVFENVFRNAVEHGSTSPRSHAHDDAVEHGSTSSQPEADDAVEHGSTSPREDVVEHVGPDVTVRVGGLDDGFFVEDDGPGLPADRRDALFESGYSTNEAGTGLGLDIVEQVVDAHGWEITATESDDGGARFEVTGVDTASDDSELVVDR